MNFRLPLTAIALLALSACSQESPPAAKPVADASPAPAAPAPARPDPAAREPQGDCDLVSAQEISAAFNGKLTVRRTSGRGGRGSSCTYTLAEVPDSQIIVQAGDEAAHVTRRETYSGYRGVSMLPLSIGKEAFLVNGAQVIVLGDDGQSLSLGLTLIAFQTPSPVSDDEVSAGVETLARSAFPRL